MRTKIFAMIVAVMMVCLLAGCECEHTWTQADCTTPQTCTECGEIQGDALGHSWQESNCELPETCSACGATQGEPSHNWKEATCRSPKTCQDCDLKEGSVLSHDYKLEKFEGDTMKYRCRLCSKVTSQPIDRELYSHTILVGHWDLLTVVKNGSRISANNVNGVGAYLQVSEDGAMQLYLEDGQGLDVTWEYAEYEPDGRYGLYSGFLVSTADQTRFAATISDKADEMQISIVLSDNETVVLQNNGLLSEIFVGVWSDFSQDQYYYVELSSDRTFTANFDGGVSGTWHLKPIYGSYAADTVNLTLSYSVNEEPVIRILPVTLDKYGEAMLKLKQNVDLLYHQNFSMKDSVSGRNLTFSTPNQGEFFENAVVSEDATLILGQWTSKEVVRLVYATRSSTTEKTSEFTAEFLEDGTFSMDIGKEITGSWYYICTSKSDRDTIYRFNLEGTAWGSIPQITLRIAGSKVTWSYSEYIGSDGTEYVFQR